MDILKRLSIVWLGCILIYALTGCMQLTGIQKIKYGDFEMVSNSGIGISADVQQYDHVLDRKGMNIEAIDNRKQEKY